MGFVYLDIIQNKLSNKYIASHGVTSYVMSVFLKLHLVSLSSISLFLSCVAVFLSTSCRGCTPELHGRRGRRGPQGRHGPQGRRGQHEPRGPREQRELGGP